MWGGGYVEVYLSRFFPPLLSSLSGALSREHSSEEDGNGGNGAGGNL